MSKILIIEDEKDLLELYSDILGDAGHLVITCNNGTDGLQNLKTERFDIIISDKNMGKVTGLEILSYCEENLIETPIFMITGDSYDNVEFKNPKSRLIKKPFEFKNLLAWIEQL